MGLDSMKSAEATKALTFTDSGGQDRTVHVLGAKRIGQGGSGHIYRVRARLDMDPDAPETSMILKDYTGQFFDDQTVPYAGRQFALQQAVESQKKWESLRKAKVRTWTTYRLNRDGGAVLMSDGETPNSIVFSDNPSSSRKEILAWGPFTLTDFEKTVDDVIEDAIRAGKARIKLPPDAFFTRLTRSDAGDVRMQYFAGDLEYIDDNPFVVDQSFPNLLSLKANMPNTFQYISNIDPIEVARCKEIIEKRIQKAIDDLGE